MKLHPLPNQPLKRLISVVLLLLLCLNANAAGITPEARTPAMMAMGDSGEGVLILQKALLTLGYFEGSVDGVYNLKTATAVRNYQEDNGFIATGVADSETITAIVESVNNRLSAPLSKPKPNANVPESPAGSNNGLTVIASYSLSSVSSFINEPRPGIVDDEAPSLLQYSQPHAFYQSNHLNAILDR